MASSNTLSLKDFQRIVFFTGAGLSAQSGLATYRGRGGVWAQYNYEEYACQRAFERDPEKVWDFHDTRRAKVLSCEPNRGHDLIAAIQCERPGTVVITQNVDGLHQRAGSPDVIELHGSLWRVRCDREGTVTPNFEIPIANRRCTCGAYWRPDIVWFEDPLRADTLQRAADAIGQCDVLVSIGTSAVVFPAAELPRIAMAHGATTIEINLDDTPMTPLYTHALRGSATEILGQLWPGVA
ncbi:MAG: NAD-dependent protein deacylase [Candidatus Hydrogenedentota bacterium]